MGLAEQQRLLARLYTDPQTRGAFQSDPRRVGAEFGLGAEESDRLAERSGEQIQRFAQMLRFKRFGEVRDLLPATAQALGDDASRRLFLEFARDFTPLGIHKHRADAVAFADHLASTIANRSASDPELPDWIGDLARCEAANLLMADPRRRWVVRRFGHDVRDCVRAQWRGEPIPSPTRGRWLGVWLRWRRGQPFRVRWIGL